MLKTTANMRLGDLSVGFVYSIAAAIAQHGQSTTELFERFELSPARLAEPHARLSIPRYMRLGHAAISLTGDPALGLAIGLYSLLSHLGLAGIAAALAPVRSKRRLWNPACSPWSKTPSLKCWRVSPHWKKPVA